eukprot:TRINITY_DN61755_c0_g1_i1.p1 TRINITY_DN61755_c0_g1~~TRINITY_DN61755_c0_g1_i1.p1  ORF type:complete len:111 (-),score=2.45 TRINITY_DN61755_c0_g1_i1:103-435(-)
MTAIPEPNGKPLSRSQHKNLRRFAAQIVERANTMSIVEKCGKCLVDHKRTRSDIKTCFTSSAEHVLKAAVPFHEKSGAGTLRCRTRSMLSRGSLTARHPMHCNVLFQSAP